MSLYYLLKNLDREKFDPFMAYYFFNTGPDTAKIRSLNVPVCFLKSTREASDYWFIRFLRRRSPFKLIRILKLFSRNFLEFILIKIPQFWNLMWFLKRNDIHLIFFNNDICFHSLGAFVAKVSKIPSVCKTIGLNRAGVLKAITTPFVDLFIAISTESAIDQVKVSPSSRKIVTIYEGIDLKMYQPDGGTARKTRAELSIPSEKKIVAHISRFVEGKGQIELLEAFSLIVKEYPQVVFLMVGEGELIRDLQMKTGRLSMSNEIIFTGWRNDIPGILSACDVFVHCPTSFKEGMPLNNLEAMAMGKPTVVSDNGGLTDAVINGVTGYVIPRGDVNKMAEMIIRLLKNEKMAVQFGKRARERVSLEFDIAKNVRKYEAIFDEYSLCKRNANE